MIELIDIETIYLGIHGINTVAFDAQLPKDKRKAIKLVDDAIAKMNDEFLNSVPERHSI